MQGVPQAKKDWKRDGRGHEGLTGLGGSENEERRLTRMGTGAKGRGASETGTDGRGASVNEGNKCVLEKWDIVARERVKKTRWQSDGGE